MAKLRDDYEETPGDNTAAPPIGAPEEHAPSAVNDISRRVMAAIAELGDEFDTLIDRDSLEPGYTVPAKLEGMSRQDPAAVAITGGTLAGEGAGLLNVDAVTLQGLAADALAQVAQPTTFLDTLTVTGLFTALAGEGAGLLNVDAVTLQGLAADALAQLDQPTTFLDTLTVTGLFTALAGVEVTGDGAVGGNLSVGGSHDITGLLTIGDQVGGGDALSSFWDHAASQYRDLGWNLAGDEFGVEDRTGFLRTLIHSGNIDDFVDDGGDADSLGGVPAVDYMRKDIDQTMAGALVANGLLSIMSLANVGDIQWNVSGTKGSLRIGTLLIAFGVDIEDLEYGVTFSANPMAIVLTPLNNNSSSNDAHVQVVGLSSANIYTNPNVSYFFIVIGAA